MKRLLVLSIVVAFFGLPVLAGPDQVLNNGSDTKRIVYQTQSDNGEHYGPTVIRPQQRPQYLGRIVRRPTESIARVQARHPAGRDLPRNVLMLRDRNGNPTVPYIWSTGSFR
jgi:hypothetical protein